MIDEESESSPINEKGNKDEILLEKKKITFLKKYYNKYIYSIKSSYILVLFIIIISSFLITKGLGPTKAICICTIGKNENRYIREYVEFYKKMKVDKIFLYDNNDINGERFEEVISDYIRNDFVEIIDYRGLKTPQQRSYQECYKKNMDLYDWFIVYDIDEYIYMKDFDNIKDFLGDKRFLHCQRVQLNWVIYTDNNLIYYDNMTLQERFTEKEPNARKMKYGGKQQIKSIVRGHIPNINIHCIHVLDSKLRSCDGFGNRKKVIDIFTMVSDYTNYYIKHYFSKSLEEFVEKIMKTDAYHKLTKEVQLMKIEKYFTYNEITNMKLDYIENRTNLNLSEYRKRIKK